MAINPPLWRGRRKGKGSQKEANAAKKNKEMKMSYLTPDQLCQMLQIKKDKLYKMTSQKRIPFFKVGNELRFDPAEVTKVFEVKNTVKRVLA